MKKIINKAIAILLSAITIVSASVIPATVASAATSVSVKTGTYYVIKSVGSNKYLNVYGSRSANNTNVTIYQKDGTKGEDFLFTKNGNAYTITPRCSTSRRLNVYGTSAKQRANICIWNATGSSTQRWIIKAVSGGYIICCADNTDYVLTATGSSNSSNVNLQKYTGSKYQIWSCSAFNQSSTTTTSSSTLNSKYYNKLNTFTVNNTKYYEVKLTSNYKGVAKGTTAFITTGGKVVTDKSTLEKLLYTGMVNSCSSNWISMANNYKSAVVGLNDACQSIMTAQFKQKVLGSISGSFTSIMLSKNPKSLISSCTYLTEEGYIDCLTAILIQQVTDVCISNSNSINSMCSNGVNSYEEAVKVKNALVNAKMAFDFAGTDCMLGLTSKYTSMSKAVTASLKTHFSAMFNTLIGTYGSKLGNVVDLYSNGSTCLEALKNIYGYNKYLSNAKTTFNNLIDNNVNKKLSSLVSTQNKLK